MSCTTRLCTELIILFCPRYYDDKGVLLELCNKVSSGCLTCCFHESAVACECIACCNHLTANHLTAKGWQPTIRRLMSSITSVPGMLPMEYCEEKHCHYNDRWAVSPCYCNQNGSAGHGQHKRHLQVLHDKLFQCFSLKPLLTCLMS